MENPKRTDQLTILVEAHDVISLEKNLLKNPNLLCGVDFGIVGLCKKSPSVREYLRKNKSAVERACELGYLDAVTVFLLNGCSPNLPTSDGRLIHTVFNCLKSSRKVTENGEGLQIIRLMISLDCDFNVKDHCHKSPLMMAAELADGHIMRTTMPHCMDWQLYPPDGFTPLHMACMQGNIGCVRQLVARMTTISLDTKDEKLYTPLMYSIIMLTNNFQLHSWKNNKEERKLWVMQYKHISVIEFLLSSGASCLNKGESQSVDPNSSSLCQTPLHSLLQILNKCKILSMYACPDDIISYNLNNEFLCSSSHGVLEAEMNAKKIDKLKWYERATSPYLCLIRLLIYSGSDIFNHDNFQYLTESENNPNLRGFFQEVKYFITEHRKNNKREIVPSLLSLCRSTIRLKTGKCDKLHELSSLNLPCKMIWYIMFVDF